MRPFKMDKRNFPQARSPRCVVHAQIFRSYQQHYWPILWFTLLDLRLLTNRLFPHIINIIWHCSNSMQPFKWFPCCALERFNLPTIVTLSMKNKGKLRRPKKQPSFINSLIKRARGFTKKYCGLSFPINPGCVGWFIERKFEFFFSLQA